MREKSIAIGFPGQGPHEPDKMERLISEYPRALDVVLEGEETLHRPLLPLLLRERNESSTTHENQVRLYLSHCALWFSAEDVGVLPEDGDKVFLGASAGEVAAGMAAEAYDFPTGLQIIDVRGEEMQKASIINPGTMLTVSGLPFKEAKKIASNFEGVHAVNDNPGVQTVFSGDEVGLKAVAEYLASSQDWSHVSIDWPAIYEAAHAPHMGPAVARVAATVRKAKIRKPSHDFLGNRGMPLRTARGIKGHIPAQLVRGVLLRQSAQALQEDYNIATFYDVGPGKVLYSQMKRQFRKSVEVVSIVDELLPEKE